MSEQITHAPCNEHDCPYCRQCLPSTPRFVSPIQTGWVCPKCGAVYAPHNAEMLRLFTTYEGYVMNEQQVTIDEIIDDLEYLTKAAIGHSANEIADRINKHGIAPPSGYCIVPIEPTQAMIEAGQDISKNTAWTYSGCYKAMLEAYIKETK